MVRNERFLVEFTSLIVRRSDELMVQIVHVTSGTVKKATSNSLPVGAAQIASAPELDQRGNPITLRPTTAMQVTPTLPVHNFGNGVVGVSTAALALGSSTWINIATGAAITVPPSPAVTRVLMYPGASGAAGASGGFVEVAGDQVANRVKQGWSTVTSIGPQPPQDGSEVIPTLPLHVDPSGQVVVFAGSIWRTLDGQAA